MAVLLTENNCNALKCLRKPSNINSFDILSLISLSFKSCDSHCFSIRPKLKSKTILLNTKVLLICIILLTFTFNCVECDSNSNKIYINEFAISLKKAKCDVDSAHSLAAKHGFELVGPIGSLDCHYLFRLHHISKRSTNLSHAHHSRLDQDLDVSPVIISSLPVLHSDTSGTGLVVRTAAHQKTAQKGLLVSRWLA